MITSAFSSLVSLYALVLLSWSLLLILAMKVLYVIFYKVFNIIANESTALVTGTFVLCAAILATGQYDTLLTTSQVVQNTLATDAIVGLGYYTAEYSLLIIIILSVLFLISALITRFVFGVSIAQSLKDDNRSVALLFAFVLTALALLSRDYATGITEAFAPAIILPSIR